MERLGDLARRGFELSDKDNAGTLTKAEIVKAVKTEPDVETFIKTCGEENLMFLLHPPRLKKALEALDADGSGSVDAEGLRRGLRGMAGGAFADLTRKHAPRLGLLAVHGWAAARRSAPHR